MFLFVLEDTWLLTDGMNVGIVQLIGRAIRKRKMTKPKDKIVSIGVCNYGCVKNLSDFQRPEHMDEAQMTSKEADKTRVCSFCFHLILFITGHLTFLLD